MDANEERLDRLIGVMEDQIRSTRTLDDTVQNLLPLLVNSGRGAATNRATTTVTQTDRTPMWVCVVIVVALATALLTKESNKATQMVAVQADLTRKAGEITEIRAEIRDLRATDNAVRAYINTGILKPKNEAAKTGKGN